MLTPNQSAEWPTATKAGTTLRRGYWCECISPGMNASIDVDTPAQAVRWIRVTLRTIASALEPEASATAWTWITTGHTTMLHALTHGQAEALTLTHNGTRMDLPRRNTRNTRPLSNNLLYGFKHPAALRFAGRAPGCVRARAPASGPLGAASADARPRG